MAIVTALLQLVVISTSDSIDSNAHGKNEIIIVKPKITQL